MGLVIDNHVVTASMDERDILELFGPCPTMFIFRMAWNSPSVREFAKRYPELTRLLHRERSPHIGICYGILIPLDPGCIHQNDDITDSSDTDYWREFFKSICRGKILGDYSLEHNTFLGKDIRVLRKKKDVDSAIKLQSYMRRYLASTLVQKMRYDPDVLFDKSFGRIRRCYLGVDDKNWQSLS